MGFAQRRVSGTSESTSRSGCNDATKVWRPSCRASAGRLAVSNELQYIFVTIRSHTIWKHGGMP